MKTIWGSIPSLKSTPTVSYRWSNSYTLPFCNRFGVHTAQNSCSFRTNYGQHVDPEIAGYVYERGMCGFANVRANPDGPLYDDFAATWKALTEGPWLDGFSLSIDENKVNTFPRRTVNFSEAAWKMNGLRPSQSLNLYYADTSYGNYYDQPQTQVSEISATINSGNGTGLLCPELYAAVRATPAELDRYLDAYGRFVTSALELVPASRGSVVLYGASYVQIGDWSNYVVPSTDIKAHYARMYRAFATDPRFAECAGIGCGGMICGGEELLRWVARMVRYYALEGGTGDLAAEYGFDWAPGLVKNADMDEGLAGWTAKGEIAAERLGRYGGRPCPADSGTPWRHSPRAPHRRTSFRRRCGGSGPVRTMPFSAASPTGTRRRPAAARCGARRPRSASPCGWRARARCRSCASRRYRRSGGRWGCVRLGTCSAPTRRRRGSCSSTATTTARRRPRASGRP